MKYFLPPAVTEAHINQLKNGELPVRLAVHLITELATYAHDLHLKQLNCHAEYYQEAETTLTWGTIQKANGAFHTAKATFLECYVEFYEYYVDSALQETDIKEEASARLERAGDEMQSTTTFRSSFKDHLETICNIDESASENEPSDEASENEEMSITSSPDNPEDLDDWFDHLMDLAVLCYAEKSKYETYHGAALQPCFAEHTQEISQNMIDFSNSYRSYYEKYKKCYVAYHRLFHPNDTSTTENALALQAANDFEHANQAGLIFRDAFYTVLQTRFPEKSAHLQSYNLSFFAPEEKALPNTGSQNLYSQSLG